MAFVTIRHCGDKGRRVLPAFCLRPSDNDQQIFSDVLTTGYDALLAAAYAAGPVVFSCTLPNGAAVRIVADDTAAKAQALARIKAACWGTATNTIALTERNTDYSPGQQGCTLEPGDTVQIRADMVARVCDGTLRQLDASTGQPIDIAALKQIRQLTAQLGPERVARYQGLCAKHGHAGAMAILSEQADEAPAKRSGAKT